PVVSPDQALVPRADGRRCARAYGLTVKATVDIPSVDDQLEHSDPPNPFGLIVVGVDDTLESLEAVRQAGELAGVNSSIELAAVGIEGAAAVVGRAEAELAHLPARVVTRKIEGDHTADRLLAEAA